MTIVCESGTHQASLASVFSDADGDDLTITASSSNESVATVSVSADYAAFTVPAQARGTATITVTADDGTATVGDALTVAVKASPAVASAVAYVSELGGRCDPRSLPVRHLQRCRRDALTISTQALDSTVVQVSNTIDPSTGSATAITVTAQDSAGNSVKDEFDVTVPAAEQQQQQAVELLGSVVGLELTATAEDSATVSWSAPETGGAPDGYIVHISPEYGGKDRTKTPKAKKTQVKFNNLQSGQTYAVRVRAQNEAGKGERVHATVILPEEGDGQTGQRSALEGQDEGGIRLRLGAPFGNYIPKFT